MASSALIDDLLKQFAENPRRVFARLANEYRKRGELDTAIEICRAHVPLQPTYISGYIVLGQALYETGQLDEARATFETALGLDPENLIGLRQLGDIARAKGDASGALGWYKRLLEVDPQNDEVEALLRELEAPAGSPPASPAGEPIGWGDINPEASTAPAQPPAPGKESAPATTPEAPAKKDLDFDYDVLSSFGEAEALPPLEPPMLDAPADAAAPAQHASEREAPAAGAAAHADGESSSHDEPLPAAFITETMAELYLQQGHREQALDIYRLLLAQRPGDMSLLNRIARLEQPAPAAPVERTVRAFFGRFANRRPPGVRTETDLAAVPAPAASSALAEELPPLDAEAAAPQPAVPSPDESEPAEPAAASAPAEEVAAAVVADAADGASPNEAAAPVSSGAEVAGEEPPIEQLASADWMAPEADEASIADFAPAEPETAAAPPATERDVAAEAAEASPEPAGAEPAPAFTPNRVLSFTELFQDRSASAADEQAAATLAGAFGAEAGMPNGGGRAARAAADALSLDDVFGGGAHESTPQTFDEFFAPRDAEPEGAAERASAPGSTPPAARRGDDADLELFHQWLEGLKK